jgi:hypothetical protein
MRKRDKDIAHYSHRLEFWRGKKDVHVILMSIP